MLQLVILLLASSSVTLYSEVVREYHLMNENKEWEEAQAYCREYFTDLVTIGSHDEMKTLITLTNNMTGEIWIGLKKTGMLTWSWSIGEKNGLAEYSNWAASPVSSQHCGSMRGDGKWISGLCTTTRPFVCQGGGMHVVLGEKNWRDAQTYCRQNYIDLASASSETENHAVQQLISNMSLSSVWFGLFRDDWKWSDSKSSFRYWHQYQPNDDGSCVLFRPSSKGWWDRPCTYTYPFYCYKVHKKHVKIVRVEMKSDPSSDFNDVAMSDAILRELLQKYQGLYLQWRVQPDGKVFQKKQKKN
ncbi:C-type mannose receptor 2-like [Eleginops maclovinus]|uniref:C-type mannose receptor 2-like n=1 Tax=Eleginops maclovinus TaxID=56733 RepID=UPI00307FE0E3